MKTALSVALIWALSAAALLAAAAASWILVNSLDGLIRIMDALGAA